MRPSNMSARGPPAPDGIDDLSPLGGPDDPLPDITRSTFQVHARKSNIMLWLALDSARECILDIYSYLLFRMSGSESSPRLGQIISLNLRLLSCIC